MAYAQFYAWMNGFKKGFTAFGHTIGIIPNTLLLLTVYFIAVGLTSCIAKIFGTRFLETKISKHTPTYWVPLHLGKKKIEDYYRQA